MSGAAASLLEVLGEKTAISTLLAWRSLSSLTRNQGPEAFQTKQTEHVIPGRSASIASLDSASHAGISGCGDSGTSPTIPSLDLRWPPSCGSSNVGGSGLFSFRPSSQSVGAGWAIGSSVGSVSGQQQQGRWQQQQQQCAHYASKTKIEYVAISQPKWDPCTLPPTNYVQLLNALHLAPNLARLEELMVPELLEKYDAVHVSAALTRLPKLVTYRDKDLVESGVVAPRGSGMLPLLPVDGASPRKGSSERARALAKRLCTMLPDHAHRMYPRQAANCVWALGTLHGKLGVKVTEVGLSPEERRRRHPPVQAASPASSPHPMGADALASRPAEKAAIASGSGNDAWRDSLEGMQARMEAAGMSHGFSRAYASLLGVVSADAFAAMEAHGQPMEAAQLLKGMALLPRSCQPHTIVTGISHFIADRAEGFGARELRTAAWAIASMSDARRNGGPEAIEAAGAALTAIAARAVQLERQFTPAAAAALMWAFAACGGEGGLQLVPRDAVTELFSALAKEIPPQVVLVTPQDISMITWACSKLGHRDPALLELLCGKATQLLEGFKPSELAQTLLALSELGAAHHGGLFAATVRSAAREHEVSDALGVETVAKTMRAFASSSGWAALAENGNSSSGGGGQDGAAAAPSKLQLTALGMLRRLRAPLAAALAQQRIKCAPQDVTRLAKALARVQEREREAGMLGAPASRASSAAQPAGTDDKALLSALVAGAEGLIPACSLGQVAQLVTAMQRLDLSSDGLMLAAAASSYVKLLLARTQQQRAGMWVGREGSRLLGNAVEVQQACFRLGLNDATLLVAIEQLLVSAEDRVRRGEDDRFGVTSLTGTQLVQLMDSLHPAGGVGVGGGKKNLRGAVSRLLLSPTTTRGRGEESVGVLANAFAVYASGAAAAVAEAWNKPSVDKESGGSSSTVAAAAAAEDEALASDFVALGWLAGELLPRAGELSATSEGAALVAAVAKAVAAASASSTSSAAQVSPRLQTLRDALFVS